MKVGNWIMQNLLKHGKIFGFYQSSMESLKDGATQLVLVELVLSIRHTDHEEPVQTFTRSNTPAKDKVLSHSNWSKAAAEISLLSAESSATANSWKALELRKMQPCSHWQPKMRKSAGSEGLSPGGHLEA